MEPRPEVAIDSDLHAWSRATGNSLVDVTEHGTTRRYVFEKGPPKRSEHKLAAIVSDDGLFELLSPLGFALAAALEGHAVSLYSRARPCGCWHRATGRPATATVIDDGPRRDELYAKLVSVMNQFADYETMTDRRIPIVVLERTVSAP